jgi:hypothetical protein
MTIPFALKILQTNRIIAFLQWHNVRFVIIASMKSIVIIDIMVTNKILRTII